MKSLKLCLMTLYHPIVVTEHIKRHRGEKKNWLPVIVLLVLTLAVRILSIYGTHYPLASVSVRKANLLLECGKLFVPVLTWVLASYMMTTILDGETLLSETLLFSAYALTPYIVFTPILTLASRIMDGSQIGLFATLEVGVLAWVVLLMILALKEMNGYSRRNHYGHPRSHCQTNPGALPSAWDHAERACDDLCGSAGDDQKHSERREQKSRRRYDQKALRRL